MIQRQLNLQDEKSDWDFLVIPQNGLGKIKIAEPCKIDIFVWNKEFLKCDIYNYKENGFLALILLINALTHEELKNQIDYEYYVCKILQNSIIDRSINKLDNSGKLRKLVYYKYILYYYLKNNYSFDFSDEQIDIVQRAHDRKLNQKDQDQLNKDILELLNEKLLLI